MYKLILVSAFLKGANMNELLVIENMLWIKDYCLVKENDDLDPEKESLENQLKMAINNVTAIQLKLNTVHGIYDYGNIFN
jgi:translation elongation factor EF-1alpha